MFFANLRIIIKSQYIRNKKFTSTEIKNTRHSSGLGVMAKIISSIEPDEW